MLACSSPDAGTGAPPGPAAATGPAPTLYGFWGLNGLRTEAGLRTVRERFGIGVYHTATRFPEEGTQVLLPAARAAGLKVSMRLTGGHAQYTDEHGNFSLAAWSERLEAWRGSGLQDFVDDGTLVAHMLLDDIHNFGGQDPTADELDEMARQSKALLPGLMVFVRERALEMPEGTYQHVDAIVNQYRHDHGTPEEYVRTQVARARELGLGVINGLNIANGGDGSSGQPGWGEGRWAMSADEITSYGRVLGAVPDQPMFLCWEYDAEERWTDGSVGATWFDQPEQTAALKDLGAWLAAR